MQPFNHKYRYVKAISTNMKKLILFPILLFSTFLFAQFGSRKVINNNFPLGSSIYIQDLNNDGLKDVIAGSSYSDSLVWFKSLSSDSIDATIRLISNSTDLGDLIADDIDGNGWADILFSNWQDSSIKYIPNLGGETFGSQQTIANGLFGIGDLLFCDINNDGLKDILVASYYNILWFQNLGDGNFGSSQVISNVGAHVIHLADLTNDGYLDIISGSANDLAWHENLISSFGVKQVINLVQSPSSICTDDINGDGNNDIISWYDDTYLEWYENLGGGVFTTPNYIDNISPNGGDLFSVDVDLDGDNDLITGTDFGIYWYENIADTISGFQQFIDIIFTGVFSTYTDDINNDGDVDIAVVRGNYYESFLHHQNYLSGRLFYDVNQNGINDSTDIGIPIHGVSTLPQSALIFTGSNGYYTNAFNDTAGQYQIYPPNIPFWTITTDSLYYSVSLDSTNNYRDSLDFGYSPDTTITNIFFDLSNGWTLCNNPTNFFINLFSLSTHTSKGIIEFEVDSLTPYISSANTPDSILGRSIFWHFDSITPFSNKVISCQLGYPNLTNIGDTIRFYLHFYQLDSINNVTYISHDSVKQIVLCAYDPNDKSVEPKGVGTEGYIANNQELEYLLRFQNTGNDTALNVVIRDPLDSNLDWSTMQIVAYSHPIQAWVEQDGKAVFKFENIMLPDSGADFLGSQGFVKFKIRPDTGLTPNTPIFNTGHIYFDFNPAVITNTVLNTIDTTGFGVGVEQISFTETADIIVFPNPFQDNLTVYYKGKINTQYDLVLFDVTGKEAYRQENITSNKATINLSKLNEGFYIIVGTDKYGKRLFSERVIAQ